MKEALFHIPNISCGHCIRAIQQELGDMDGVESVEGDPVSKRVTVRFTDPAERSALVSSLEEIGYPPED